MVFLVLFNSIPVACTTLTDCNLGIPFVKTIKTAITSYEDFFDVEGNHLDIRQWGYDNAPVIPALPKNFEKMVQLAKKLAQNTYHVRVDFYEIGERVYFGELTFFDGGGLCPFNKPEYGRQLCDWIKLPADIQ